MFHLETQRNALENVELDGFQIGFRIEFLQIVFLFFHF